jgi:cell division inhibitor SulA
MASIQARLRSIPNISEFCRRHGLPLRTVMRLRSGGEPRAGTVALLERALRLERR